MERLTIDEDGSEVAVRKSSRWLRVLVYYMIAVGLAAASRFVWHTNDVPTDWPSLSTMHWHLISGIGPFLGAIVVWIAFRPQRLKSFGGTNAPIAWALLFVPATTMSVIGVHNPYSIHSHLFGFYLGSWIAVYAVLEETGWRGYLQDEFCDLSPLLRYTIVAFFWYAWHFTFLQHHSLFNELAIFGLLLSASVGLGFIADRTSSIFAAASLHTSANILGLTAFFTVFIPYLSTRLFIVGICVAIWVAMLRVWRYRTVARAKQRSSQM